jgi:putative tryptophan/tyrosine transport system substrate-binding protein
VTGHIGRRELITLLGGAAAAWPLAVRAQQPAMPVVGLLWVASERVVKPYEESIRAGLRELGWVDGANFRLEVRYGNGEAAARLPGLIDELIALNPKVLSGISEVVALMKAKTSTIPIVLSLSYDPVESGLVQSLARPGGNITGIAVHYDEVITKHVEIATELVPGLARIGFINDAADPGAVRFDALAEKAARSKGLTLVPMPMPVRDRASVEAAYVGLGAERPGALIVMLSGRLFNLRDPIREGALKLRAPVIYPFEGFVEAGGLVSYGPNYYAAFRRSTVYVDKILKGTKPGDLPVEQPTRLDLVVNVTPRVPSEASECGGLVL